MRIGQLTIGIGADARGLTRDLAPITAQLAALEAQASRAGSALGSAAAGGGAGGGAGFGQPATQAADASRGMREALAPLATIGDRISTQLNRVGGTIVTLARRIDSSMKTPLTLKALEALQKKFEGTWKGAAAGAAAAALKVKDALGNMGDVARRDLDQVTKLRFGGAISGLTGIKTATAAIGPAARAATGPVRALGREIAIATGVFGAAYSVVGFFKSAFTGASDLNETLSKTGVIFGESAGAVTAQADDLAKRFGMARRETLDAAANFGIMAKAAGKTEAEAADMAQALTMAAANAASINNTSVPEALEKIRSGLAGEAEPLRTFGVMLNEAQVKAEAAALGIARMGAELTEAQKITARASLIQKGLAYANGDLERTLTGPANQARKLAGTMANLSASIGEALMPLAGPLLQGIGAVAASAADAFERIKPAATEFAQTTLGYVVEGLAKAADAGEFLYRQLAYSWPVFEAGFATVADAAAAAGRGIRALARYGLDAAAAIAQMGLSAARTLDSLTGTSLAAGLEALPGQITSLARTISDAWQHAAPGEGLGDQIRGFFGDIRRGASEAAAASTAAANAIGSVAAATLPGTKEIEAMEAALRSKIAGLGKPGGLEDDIAKTKAKTGAEDPQFDQVRSLEKQARLMEGRIKAEQELHQAAQQTIADTMTPQERYDAKVNELKTLYDTGKIDAATFNRASASSYRETMGQGNRQYAGAAQAGSREAYSAMLADLGRRRDDPVKVTAKNSDVQVKEAQKQTGLMQKIAELLEGRLDGGAEVFALGA